MRNVDDTPYTKENDMKKMVSCNGASKATMPSIGSLELLLRATLPREVLGASLSTRVSCGW